MPMVSREILGVRVDFGMNIDDVIDVIEKKLLSDNHSHYVCTTNPEFVMEAQKDSEFKKIVNESDLSLPDGVGVIQAKDYLDKVRKIKKDFIFPFKALVAGLTLGFRGGQYKERITGVELTYKLCELSNKRGYSIFFLGGRPKSITGKLLAMNDTEISSLASEEIKKIYPNVNIVGSSSKFSYGKSDDDMTIKYIKECMGKQSTDVIDFLFVAYGHPNQEKWIARNRGKIPAKVSIGVGGTFEYIVGHSILPPENYVKRNLGWLYRVSRQPWRIKRVFNAFPIFPIRVFLSSIR